MNDGRNPNLEKMVNLGGDIVCNLKLSENNNQLDLSFLSKNQRNKKFTKTWVNNIITGYCIMESNHDYHLFLSCQDLFDLLYCPKQITIGKLNQSINNVNGIMINSIDRAFVDNNCFYTNNLPQIRILVEYSNEDPRNHSVFIRDYYYVVEIDKNGINIGSIGYELDKKLDLVNRKVDDLTNAIKYLSTVTFYLKEKIEILKS